MNALEAPEEAAISVSVLQLTVNDQLEPTTQDSFSSQPDSTFNKGAMLFLELLEKAKEDAKTKAEALRFEDLVIQMLDLSMDKKLSSPDAITDMLNDQGWNAAQVARVWQVSTTADDGPSWSHEKLTMLGGKDVAKDVWITLKGRELTGNPKRRLADDCAAPCVAKKSRTSSVTSKGTLCVLSGSQENPEPLDASILKIDSQSTPVATPPHSRRKRRRPRRSQLLATPRITQWFAATPKTPKETPDQPVVLPTQATPSLPTKKRASRKKKAVPPPILMPPSPKNVAGSPSKEKATAKKTSPENQTTKIKEDLALKKERSQHFPNQICNMEGAVQRYDD